MMDFRGSFITHVDFHFNKRERELSSSKRAVDISAESCNRSIQASRFYISHKCILCLFREQLYLEFIWRAQAKCKYFILVVCTKIKSNGKRGGGGGGGGGGGEGRR
jgi:uncharacterized membrane protein YgcG